MKYKGMKPKPIAADEWRNLGPEWIAERKVDGHGGIVEFDANGTASFYTGHNVTAFIPSLCCPELANTVVQVEFCATRDGRKYSMSADASVLLSLGGRDRVETARIFILGVMKYKGKDMSTVSYDDRQLRRSIVTDAIDREWSIYPWFVSLPEKASGLARNRTVVQWIADGAEGVVFKKAGSLIRSGARSPDWLKFKPTHTIDAWCRSYKKGTGKFAGIVGSLVLELMSDDGKQMIGVGRCSGMDDAMRIELTGRLDCGLAFVVEAEYERWTVGGRLRHARFKRLRPDKGLADCTMALQGPKATVGAVVKAVKQTPLKAIDSSWVKCTDGSWPAGLVMRIAGKYGIGQLSFSVDAVTGVYNDTQITFYARNDEIGIGLGKMIHRLV